MNAREELHESMCGSCSGPHVARGECEAVDRAIDAYAHELAEKQRAWARVPGQVVRVEVGEDQVASIVIAAVDIVADLIDPEVSSGD